MPLFKSWSSSKKEPSAEDGDQNLKGKDLTLEDIQHEMLQDGPDGKSAPPPVLSDKTEAEVEQFVGMLISKIESDSKLKSLTSVKAHCQNKPHYDLQRFLRARNYDVDKALAQYKATQIWRDTYSIDKIGKVTLNEHGTIKTILVVDPHEALCHWTCPQSHHGWDKEGRPIYIERAGRVHMPTLLKHMTEDECVFRHVRQMEVIMERMRISSKLHGRNVETQTHIMDLENLSMKPDLASMRIFKRTIGIDQDYYPERLGKFFFLNCPRFFGITWELVRHFIDPNTARKLEILGGEYTERLLEFIPSKHLPTDFGGTCKCGGWDGKQEQCLGELHPIPKDYPTVADARAPLDAKDLYWNQVPKKSEAEEMMESGYFDDDSDDMD